MTKVLSFFYSLDVDTILFLFLQYCSQNSGLHTCWAVTPLLEACLQPSFLFFVFVVVVFFFVCLFLKQWLAFCPDWPDLWSSKFMLPTRVGLTGTCHHIQHFCLGWLEPTVLLISAFHTTWITQCHSATVLSYWIGSWKHFAQIGLQLLSL